MNRGKIIKRRDYTYIRMEVLILIGFIGTIVTVIASASTLAYWLGRKFVSIDAKFREIDSRFEGVNSRFEELNRKISNVAQFTKSTFTLLIDFMSMKGLFTKEEKDFIIRDLERLSTTLSTNPLTPEEAKFILEVVREIREKDPKEIDLSKLDKIMEIADKLLQRESTYEAARLWMLAYILKAILRKERGEY